MQSPTEQLRGEHKAVRAMLDIMEKISSRLKDGEGANPEHLEKILDFLGVFVDKCHHGKEEDFFFPAMEEGVAESKGLVEELLKEHNLGRGYIRDFREAAKNYEMGNDSLSSRIIEDIDHYVVLLRKHIEKEDDDLFVTADKRLSEEKKEELSENFEKIEQEIIGPGKHEEYHDLLHHLKEEYSA